MWTTPKQLNFVRLKDIESAQKYLAEQDGTPKTELDKKVERDKARFKKFKESTKKRIQQYFKKQAASDDDEDSDAETEEEESEPSEFTPVGRVDLEHILVNDMLHEKINIFAIKPKNK